MKECEDGGRNQKSSTTEGAHGIANLTQSGSDLVLAATNGLAGGTYQVLTSTNAVQPLNQWQPIATNVSSADGSFSITLTNVAGGSGQRFFRLEVH